MVSGVKFFKAGAPKGYRMALIGAGPASLSCAAELRKRGYETVIFDANPLPGGLDTYGIAAYKMRVHETLKEIEMVRALGVEIQSGVHVGQDVTIAELKHEFDALSIAIAQRDAHD